MRGKLPAASAAADPQALTIEAASVARQARACADRCKQAAASQQDAADSGFGDGVATTGTDPSDGESTDPINTGDPDADENANTQQEEGLASVTGLPWPARIL